MGKQLVQSPEGSISGLLVHDTLYVTARPPRHQRRDGETNQLAAQTEAVFQDTAALLRTLGLSYENAMKFTFYPRSFHENYQTVRTIRGKYLPDTQWVATSVELGLVEVDSWFEMDVVVGFTRDTVISPNVWLAPDPPRFPQTTRTAHAALIGNVYYVQGQVAWDLQGNPVGVGDMAVQTKHSYQLLEHIVASCHVSWDHVVKVTTYLRHPGDYETLREVQDRYFSPATSASTTVVAAPVDELLEEPELILSAAVPKKIVTVPGLHSERGHAHAVQVGQTIYTSAQVPLDGRGQVSAFEEFDGQAEQVFRNLGAVLRAAGASWNDIIKMNTYLRRREDGRRLTEIRSRYVASPAAVFTDLCSGPIDPRFLLQADCVALAA
jgi:enamine deaminase RidA (YjgF/YER057c/UK114 family)